MTHYAKVAMPYSQRYPWNLYLINIVDTVVFLDLEAFASDSNHMFFGGKSHFCKETTSKINSFFLYHKHWYTIHKAFQGIPLMPTLPGGSLEITLTVPLKDKYRKKIPTYVYNILVCERFMRFIIFSILQ